MNLKKINIFYDWRWDLAEEKSKFLKGEFVTLKSSYGEKYNFLKPEKYQEEGSSGKVFFGYSEHSLKPYVLKRYKLPSNFHWMNKKYKRQVLSAIKKSWQSETNFFQEIGHEVISFKVQRREQLTSYSLLTPFLGKSLGQILKEAACSPASKLTLKDALHIAVEVTRALRQLHQLNIAHGDVKPGNIVFNLEGQANFIDYGLAVKGIQLETNQFQGTCAYTPRGLITGENWSYEQLDIFALLRTLLMNDVVVAWDARSKTFAFDSVNQEVISSVFTVTQAKKMGLTALLGTQKGKILQLKTLSQLMAILIAMKEMQINGYRDFSYAFIQGFFLTFPGKTYGYVLIESYQSTCLTEQEQALKQRMFESFEWIEKFCTSIIDDLAADDGHFIQLKTMLYQKAMAYLSIKRSEHFSFSHWLSINLADTSFENKVFIRKKMRETQSALIQQYPSSSQALSKKNMKQQIAEPLVFERLNCYNKALFFAPQKEKTKEHSSDDAQYLRAKL